MSMSAQSLAQLRVGPGGGFNLAEHDTRWLPDGLASLKKKARRSAGDRLLAANKLDLEEAQALLYADGQYSVLIVLQAMDAAGKDGTIKHVMSGVNPQGCRVSGFKVPSALEVDHDFLWRYEKELPQRGQIGIFNRSYYEDVLVVRVHPQILDAQPLPEKPDGEAFWQGRYDDINNFEEHLVRNGTVVLKFFLNLSKEEQKKRFLARLDTPDKNWKFSAADIRERGYWDDYMDAFGRCINATATEVAPWWVIPADRKWAARAMVADIITNTINSLDLHYPQLSAAERKDLARARTELEAEG